MTYVTTLLERITSTKTTKSRLAIKATKKILPLKKRPIFFSFSHKNSSNATVPTIPVAAPNSIDIVIVIIKNKTRIALLSELSLTVRSLTFLSAMKNEIR